MSLLTVDNLKTYFHTREGVVRAVDGISYTVNRGETLGMVGESGSGKSVSCYSLLGLVPSPPGRIESGTAVFDGNDLLHCSLSELRAVRGGRIAMIFQDPMTALNPYMTIGDQLIEPLLLHEKIMETDARARALNMLDAVGIQDGHKNMRSYPHQLSGGMRQRVMIAMALITKPDLLIADEPTTALDVTVQAQILDLIKRMQQEIGMAMILITHDMGVIAGNCDKVLVMYAGRICEAATAEALFAKPRHPYTEALLASMPSVQSRGSELYTIPGMPPDLSKTLPPCSFEPRCAHAAASCNEQPAMLEDIATGHATACIRVREDQI